MPGVLSREQCGTLSDQGPDPWTLQFYFQEVYLGFYPMDMPAITHKTWRIMYKAARTNACSCPKEESQLYLNEHDVLLKIY